MPKRSAPLPSLESEDLFPRTRTDDELRQLVFQLAQENHEPFRYLVEKLIGEQLPELDARQRWASFVTHRRVLAGTLGRPVHLRVAALDLMALEGHERQPALVISSSAFEQLWAAATTDGLTGLANARHFRALLAHELRQRNREPLTLACLDLDGFKALNDREGHAAGDRALIEVAAGLRRIGRRGDVVGRLGGDEFALLCIGASLADARQLASRVDEGLRELLDSTGIGLSFGFAQAGEIETPETLLQRADESMYRTKRARKSGVRPARQERPLALYATTRPDAYYRMRQIFALHGVLLAPAPNAAALTALLALLKPQAVLANVLFPPRGGVATLDALPPGLESALVVPRSGWRTHAGMERAVLTADASDGVLKHLLERVSPRALAPLAPFASARQAGEVMKLVGDLARGVKVPPAKLEGLNAVAEVELLQRAMGS